jgi:hypothetical protein
LVIDHRVEEANEIARYLQRVGLRHRIMSTEDEALVCLREASFADDRYNIALVPDDMPGSLPALSRAIQVDPPDRQTSLILIRNQQAGVGRSELAECGFAASIESPLDARKLFEALDCVCAAQRGPVTAEQAPAQSATEPIAKSHILQSWKTTSLTRKSPNVMATSRPISDWFCD